MGQPPHPLGLVHACRLNARPMPKYPRIAVTALSLMACMWFVVVCYTGYESPDYDWKQLSTKRGFETVSDRGHLTFRIVDTSAYVRPWNAVISDVQDSMTLMGDETRENFRVKWDGWTLVVDMPGYLPLLLSIGFAALPWIPYRFSLLTLLAATMLVAAGLAVVAAILH